MAPTVALVLGRFLPVHNGHLWLLSEAAQGCDRLLVLVRASRGDPFDAALRGRWIAELGPASLRVAIVGDSGPLPAHDDLDGWAQVVHGALPAPWAGASLCLAAGEAHAASLAARLGASFRLVDRGTFPVSGSMIRACPSRHREHLPPPVQMHLEARGLL